MALQFDGSAGHHDYSLDGEPVPSVTQILQAQGLVQLHHVPPFILDAACARGAAVHQIIHFYNEDDLDWRSVAPQFQGYLESWIHLRAERKLHVLLCEHRIASRRQRVAGTLDLLCEFDGDGWLLDYATGNPEDVAKDFQTAAYLGLAFEWAADDPLLRKVLSLHSRWRRGAVRLRPTGQFTLTEYTDALDYSRFQTLAAAWHIRASRGALVDPSDLAA